LSASAHHVSTPTALRERLREFALGLPEAYDDHPWGETVAKVGKKVFAFLGADGSPTPSIGLKLPESQPLALAQPGVTRMRYGLGDHGWVVVRLGPETPPPMLEEWILESYRAVAPKRLVAELNAARAGRRD
jgi:predicted DNA-binding protein (MmcQ/YjbR family)